MPIQFDVSDSQDSLIKVIGVGGGGSNAVNFMYKQGIVGVNFIICNTDAQALRQSPVPVKIQLGPGLTDGRGAGSQPEIGKNATIESMDEIKKVIGHNTKMVFITAGMGGGTGTGGAPIVARAAREMGILTVGIVTAPFHFEGRKRLQQAERGIEEMKESVDTIIIVSNDKITELFGNMALSAAFSQADNILTTAAKGIAEIITVPGYVNVDFEDVNTVMKNSGVAIMGTGLADGEDRALKAVRMALSSPLLNDNDIAGAQHILLNITSGTKEVLMDELTKITNYVQEAAGHTSEVIWGNCIDEALNEKISVTVIATGFETNQAKQIARTHTSTDELPARISYRLDDEDDSLKKNTDRSKNSLSEEQFLRNTSSPKPETNKQPANRFKQPEDSLSVFMERRNRLKNLGSKLQNNLQELEREPAYKRRNVQLEDMPHSSESNVSKYSLFEDEKNKAELKKRNPFLHDNID